MRDARRSIKCNPRSAKTFMVNILLLYLHCPAARSLIHWHNAHTPFGERKKASRLAIERKRDKVEEKVEVGDEKKLSRFRNGVGCWVDGL